ncbi:MAG TPA: alpha/beta hydrolase [Acidimicrobiales bacterium]|nr:alpha/beta hydrolase [Acidimicrobiales bacterium]
MPQAKSNGIELEYDTFGQESDPPLLLIMGFSAQMTAWDEAFCRKIADQGFHVIRFDNRDVGLSSRIEGEPDLAALFSGDTSSAPYSLDDMADDAAGLLDALGLPAAHIVGASMGGMIAQTFAIRHPEKTLSLCSIMSTTGDLEVGQGTPEALGALMAPPATNREEAIERGVNAGRIISSKKHFDEAKAAKRAGEAYDRAFDPKGVQRQLAAILSQKNRTADLAKVAAPTLVIHGAGDPLVTPSGGEATAKAIPGAELRVFEDMGHDLPEPLWPEIVDAIVANARRAS